MEMSDKKKIPTEYMIVGGAILFLIILLFVSPPACAFFSLLGVMAGLVMIIITAIIKKAKKPWVILLLSNIVITIAAPVYSILTTSDIRGNTSHLAKETANQVAQAAPPIPKPQNPAAPAAKREREPKPEVPAPALLPNYKVVKEDLTDTPIKTAFELRVVIDKSTTRKQLDALMRSLHKEYMTKSGFKYHNPPNSIYAFFFFSERILKEDPTGWVGRIQHPASTSLPTYNNNVLEGDLIKVIKQAMNLKDSDAATATKVEMGNDGRTAIYTSHLTGLQNNRYETHVYPRSAWMGVFISLDLLYKRVPKLDKLTYREIHNGKTIIEISLDREQWNGMHYHKRTDLIAHAESKLMDLVLAEKLSDEAYEKKLDSVSLENYSAMLKTLPTKNVKVKKIVKLK